MHGAYIKVFACKNVQVKIEFRARQKLNASKDGEMNVFTMSIVKSILCSAHINISIRIFMLITWQRTYSPVTMLMEIPNLSAAVKLNINIKCNPNPLIGCHTIALLLKRSFCRKKSPTIATCGTGFEFVKKEVNAHKTERSRCKTWTSFFIITGFCYRPGCMLIKWKTVLNYIL